MSDQDQGAPETAAEERKASRARNGVGAAPVKPQTGHADWGYGTFTERDAPGRWTELISISDKKFGVGAADFDIAVLKTDPPPVGAGADKSGATSVGTIWGINVAGTERTSPGEALLNQVIDQIHLPSTSGPATYLLRFNSKRLGGSKVTQAYLTLESRDRIMAMRNAAAQAHQAAGIAPGPQAGFGAGPGPQAGFGNLPPGVSPFPPKEPPIPPNTDMETQARILREHAQASWEWAQKVHAAGAGAILAPAPAVSEEAIVAKTTSAVIAALTEAGVIKKPGVMTAEDVAAAVNSALDKRLGVGAVGAGGIPGAAGTAPAGPAVPQPTLGSMLRRAISERGELDTLIRQGAGALGIRLADGEEEEDPEPGPPPPEPDDDETVVIATGKSMFGKPIGRRVPRVRYDEATGERIETQPRGVIQQVWDVLDPSVNPQFAEVGGAAVIKYGAVGIGKLSEAVAKGVETIAPTIAKVIGAAGSEEQSQSGQNQAQNPPPPPPSGEPDPWR